MSSNKYNLKISIIIPAYNIEDLIVRCLESVCSQTYPKELLEIIVVDDGSTDNTFDKAKEYARDKRNVTVLHKENGGSSSARNYGLSKATGDYIGFVDSDDYVDPHMYEELMKAAMMFDAPMVQASRDEIDENGQKLPDVCIPPEKITVISGKEHLKTLLLHTGDASFCTRITKAELFKKDYGRFPENELNEDFYLMIKMISDVDKLVILPGQYYHVFYRLGSNSRKKKEDKEYFPPVFNDIVRNSDVALNLVDEKYPDLHDIAVRFCLIQRLDYLLHIPISQMKSDNRYYKKDVVEFLRHHKKDIRKNPYLTKKNRIYLQLLATAPKFVRTVHARLRGL
ncbi:glycosyltransferase family 2 protein [Butyrivibrio sp. NC2002]|uniref:glycosyltransferase family 2 protein n=1 Tax=Butyrivibrio sp. NC2002 TaxID=1410610 RepID=UPI00055A1E3B|nr:glycosyltransferase [Butyrivibrio sp. NC2002]